MQMPLAQIENAVIHKIRGTFQRPAGARDDEWPMTVDVIPGESPAALQAGKLGGQSRRLRVNHPGILAERRGLVKFSTTPKF